MQNQHKKNADKPINSTNTNAHTTQKNTLKYAQFNQLNKPHKYTLLNQLTQIHKHTLVYKR